MNEAPDLVQTFESELRKSAEQIQAHLLALEAGGGEGLQEAYRLTHSVKGAARVVGLLSIEELAHALEDRLQGLVRSGTTPAAAEVSVYLRVVDGFVAGLDAFLQGADHDPAPLLTELQTVGATEGAPRAVVTEDAEVPTAPVPAARRKDDLLRVPTASVDALFRRVEEAFLVESRLETLAGALADDAADRDRTLANLRRETARLHQVLLQFHEIVRAFRMEPLERLRVPLQRATRDVGTALRKPAAFRLGNPRLLVDTALLDALLEPLLHLVRNAVDHGLEPPEVRASAGKPAEGLVEVEGRMWGGHLELRVRDDGRGLSLPAIRRRALEAGFVSPEQAAAWSETQWLSLPFRPGFSTTEQVSAFSGRGMGLDIVRDRIRGLGGDVHLESQPGRGTTFAIRVPVRLLTSRTLLLRCGSQLAGVPVADVECVLPYRSQSALLVAGQAHVLWDGLPVPLDLLAGHLGWPGSAPEQGHAVVVHRQGSRRGVLVDEVLGEVEQPALPAPWNLRGLGYLGGLIVLGTGSVVPLLELRELLPWGAVAGSAEAAASVVPLPAPSAEKRVVLVVDDSATIRALHRSVLRSVGHEVLTADDGADGLALLHRRAVDLVITDIQMPRMDGLTLLRRIREVPAWQRLPVIVVSQYGRRDDLQKAAAAGADRYIVKSSFEPKVLTEMVAELLA
jgi:chemotaxis protein histidine kinase CheA/CheY-like chemotaxis protein